MPLRSVSIFVVLLCCAVSPAQQVLKANVFRDKTEGLRIVIPVGWEQLPIHVDERRLIALFQSKELYRGDKAKGDEGNPRHAYMKIVRLERPVVPAGARGADATRLASKAYDYQRHLSQTLRPDSFQTSVEPGSVHGSTPVVKWDVKIVSKGRDREHRFAWVFTRGAQDVAVEFHFLEEHRSSLADGYLQSLRTFKFIKPTGKTVEVFAKPIPFALNQWLELPIIERHKRRVAIGDQHEKKVLSRLPEGWDVHESKHFLLLSHTEPKVAKYVESTLLAFRKWIDERFGKLQEDHPIRTTVRLCKNSSEYHSYRRGGVRRNYSFENREIVMCNDRGNLNMKDVLWGVFHRYMLDAAPQVYFNMPVWLRESLRRLIATARWSRRGLAFPRDKHEARTFFNLDRAQREPWTIAQLMQHPHFGYDPGKNKLDNNLGLQSMVLLRFLDGPGSRSRALKRRDFLLEYMLEIRKLARELDAADENVLVWDSDAALEKLFAERRAAAAEQIGRAEAAKLWPARIPSRESRWSRYEKTRRARAKEFNRVLFERACNWSKLDGIRLQRAYEKFIDGYPR